VDADTVVLDIGAWIGVPPFWTAQIAKHVIAVEPDPKCPEILRALAPRYPNVTIIEAALATDPEVKIYAKGRFGSSGTSVLSIGTEFIRRLLLHVLPKGFNRIRHYGLLAGTAKAETIAKARDILTAGVNPDAAEIEDVATAYAHLCPCCGGRMTIVELFEPGSQPQHRPPRIRIDTS